MGVDHATKSRKKLDREDDINLAADIGDRSLDIVTATAVLDTDFHKPREQNTCSVYIQSIMLQDLHSTPSTPPRIICARQVHSG